VRLNKSSSNCLTPSRLSSSAMRFCNGPWILFLATRRARFADAESWALLRGWPGFRPNASSPSVRSWSLHLLEKPPCHSRLLRQSCNGLARFHVPHCFELELLAVRLHCHSLWSSHSDRKVFPILYSLVCLNLGVHYILSPMSPVHFVTYVPDLNLHTGPPRPRRPLPLGARRDN